MFGLRALRNVGERVLLSSARRIHHTTKISACPPSEPLRYDLRLCVNQKRFDVTVHGYWNWTAILRQIEPYVSHLLNAQPSPADLTRAKQEYDALDSQTREKLMSMWPSGDANMTTKDFMLYEFLKHALIADNTYKEKYFEKTFDVSSPYILGEKDIRSFLRDNFAPGVKYKSQFVNSELDNFVGAKTKIGYGSSGPTTLEEIAILHDENDVLTDHPDREQAHQNTQLDIIVVRR